MPKFLSNSSPIAHTEQSLGPNLQSRLEALEAAMGVRLNVAKRQGRHSLSNTASSSPMQISPTSTSSVTISTTNSSRQTISSRLGQGVQRSASSCDAENRPGPIKRLKPSLPVENSHTTTTTTTTAIHAIATVKQHQSTTRRPLISTQSTPTTTTTAVGTPRSLTSKTSVPSKTRSTPIRTINSPKPTIRSTIKTKSVLVSPSPPPPPPPPPRPSTYPRKKNQSIFGEKFSDDILKTNLLWIDLKDLDDDARTEILIQFGSIEKFLHEQHLFVANQQQQHHHHHHHQHVKSMTDNKIGTNRSRLQLLIPKKDRLELL